jgi:hypothetical protein
MLNASAGQLRGLTACFSLATCGEGGTPALARFTAPNGAGVDFSINGLMYHKADADDVWTMSGDSMAIASECIWLLCLNSAGTMSVVQGTTILTADLSSGKKVLRWPAPGDSVCAIGAVRVTTVGSVYVPGTTSLNGIATYYNFSTIPAAPLTS